MILPSRSEFAVRFAAVCVLLLTTAGLLAGLFYKLMPPILTGSPQINSRLHLYSAQYVVFSAWSECFALSRGPRSFSYAANVKVRVPTDSCRWVCRPGRFVCRNPVGMRWTCLIQAMRARTTS